MEIGDREVIVYASGSFSLDPRSSGQERWHHLDEKLLQRAVKRAVDAAETAGQLADKMIELTYVESVSHETVRKALKKTT